MVLDQQDQPRAVVELHFTADDQLESGFQCRFVCPHDAGQRGFVGDGQRGIAQHLRALEQLLCAGRATTKAEGRQTMQLGVFGRVHDVTQANQPCSWNGPVSPTAQKTQARWPREVSTT